MCRRIAIATWEFLRHTPCARYASAGNRVHRCWFFPFLFFFLSLPGSIFFLSVSRVIFSQFPSFFTILLTISSGPCFESRSKYLTQDALRVCRICTAVFETARRGSIPRRDADVLK